MRDSEVKACIEGYVVHGYISPDSVSSKCNETLYSEKMNVLTCDFDSQLWPIPCTCAGVFDLAQHEHRFTSLYYLAKHYMLSIQELCRRDSDEELPYVKMDHHRHRELT